MKQKIAYVTGADRCFFDHILLLMASLRRHSPGIELLVCDFGLTHQQREYFNHRSMLLDMPSHIKALHPWHYKAALGSYVSALETEAIVWIDADMIILSDIRAGTEAVLEDMKRRGAICAATSSNSLGEQLSAERTPHFAELASSLDHRSPYVSSGIFLCRSRELFAAWERVTNTFPMEMLFEQNAFNLVTLSQSQYLHVIDTLTWNICGPQLRDAEVLYREQNMVVQAGSTEAKILHFTSSNRARDLILYKCEIETEGHRIPASVRLFKPRDESFARFQRALLWEAFADECNLLRQCKVETGMLERG